MYVIIQIPCKNEIEMLSQTFSDLPRSLPGIRLEYMVIDDGSTDGTMELARQLWVHHIVHFVSNRGLGMAFQNGARKALMLGADILVNTDADNQYPGEYISSLIEPILQWHADLVIGNRDPVHNRYFSWNKRFLQRCGNWVVSLVAGTRVPDAVSGFRAYSREALYEINVTSRFSYVVDTLIQAYKKWLGVHWIPIHTHAPTRPSRLFRNMTEHIIKTGINIGKVYLLYEPFKVFLILSLPSLLLGTIGVIRFLYVYLTSDVGRELIQSLIISWVSITIGIALIGMGILGDVIAKNRTLLEQQLSLQKRQKYEIEE